MVETEKRLEGPREQDNASARESLAQPESRFQASARHRRPVILSSVEIASGLIALFPVRLGPEAKFAHGAKKASAHAR